MHASMVSYIRDENGGDTGIVQLVLSNALGSQAREPGCGSRSWYALIMSVSPSL